MPITIDWLKDQQYAATDGDGHGIVIESKADGPPAGFTPSQLLLVAAAGCLANHVLAILGKKRLPPAKLRITVSGERAAEHPRRYVSMDLLFEVTGDIPKETVDDVIRLSREKYCSVLNSLDPAMAVSISSKVLSQ